jgi:MIP family channel proteins
MANLGKRVLAEFLGTLFFVFISAGSAVATQALSQGGLTALLFGALVTGVGLSLAVSATMGVSGGNLNPAVSLGLLVARKLRAKDTVLYIVAQVIGATIGALLLFVLYPKSVGDAVHWGSPTLGAGVGVAQGIATEAILTFFLLLAVFGTAVDPRSPKIGGFGIGLTVAVDALVGAPVSGAAMNPARAIGPEIVSGYFTNWYVYWIGPIIGGVIASLVYSLLIEERQATAKS